VACIKAKVFFEIEVRSIDDTDVFDNLLYLFIAPCPGSPFERTVELLSTSELDRECEVTKILFLSSLNVIPNFGE